ncbi:thioredoxin [Candidatus Acetothermia bacterium]|nr:thioredoxin [Candidatus Acetothermia bacterium]MBI3643147.1 thioredoxin [Candidatus Acetothermia bacterium]
MAKPAQVGQENFQKEVLESKQPVLVDFYADWCGPCRAVAPVVEEIATELLGKLKVVKVDVDANEKLSFDYGVQSIPTLILFENGAEAERVIGFLPKVQLLSKINPHLTAGAKA